MTAPRTGWRKWVRPQTTVFIGLIVVLLLVIGRMVVPQVQFILATSRTAPVYNPPVMAGQKIIWCTGGFYAREGDRVVLVYSGHCAYEGVESRLMDGRLLGVAGPLASLADCPAGRFCAPTDALPLYVEPNMIPWGHLNEVDMTGGGYRVIPAGTRALACGDIKVGDGVEISGRNWYRSGKVIQIAPYQFATDTMFPCMVVADIAVQSGDSGAAVFVNGKPAGITAREIDGMLGFTPLEEGLENMGLTLCTEPDCGLTPPAAGQPVASPAVTDAPPSPAPSGG